MNSVNALMAVKVLILVALGAALVWWQLRDLTQEKKRCADSQATADEAASVKFRQTGDMHN